MIARIFLALGFCLLCGLGCSRPPAPGTKGHGSKAAAPEDSLQTALDALSRAATLTDYKESLHLLNKHLENQEAIQLSKEDRQALTSGFGLEKEELESIESRTFRPLDAHYLEMCFLLRDAARTIDQPGLDSLAQARLALGWVDRQVLLRESNADLLPPLYALRAGLGSASERALVFLALLQQFRIQACVLLWPEKEAGKPGPILVGVLSTGTGKKDIFLFDPRLGLPVPGPEGIATLAQLGKDPKLVSFGKNDSRPEVHLACSLSALSPRMKYLEDKLARSDRIVLASEPALLVEEVKGAAGDWKVWDRSLRVLPAFLPGAEGGTDKNSRLAMFEAQRIPMITVVQNFAAMKLIAEEDMPVKQARMMLLNFAQQLFIKYAGEPQTQLLKGQHDKAIKRLQIMRDAFNDLEFSPLQDFGKRVNIWRDNVIRLQLAVIRGNPGAKKAAEALWIRDQYLVALLNGENPDPQKHPKEELSYIVLTAVNKALGEQIIYLLAGARQEKAERNQATWERLKKAGKAEVQVRRAEDKTQYEWSIASGWWKKYVERYPLGWSGLESRFRAIQAPWQRGARGDQERALSLWDLFLSEIHRAAAARLFLAHAYQNLGQKKEALDSLRKLEGDLTALIENAEIKKELASAQEKVRGQGNTIQAAILDNLAFDLGPDGGFFWLREKARGQLQLLKNEK